MPQRSTTALGLAEALGTFLLVFFGCGAVHAAVLTGAHSGLWQVAMVWGVAIMAAIYVTGGISGAHINPAVTLALATWGKFPWGLVVPYVLGQLAGAITAALLLFVLFGPWLDAREKQHGVKRGQPGSEITAMCYGEYFPNPGPVSTDAALKDEGAVLRALQEQRGFFGPMPAFLAEVVGTLLLVLVVFALTDERNRICPPGLAPVFIGLTVAILISVIAPLTQACFNPARDFGPRLAAWALGWGEVAIPGPRPPGFLTVYVLAPIVGAVLGGGLYTAVLRPCLPDPPPALEV
jgi:glycerol uptake facilitator protein